MRTARITGAAPVGSYWLKKKCSRRPQKSILADSAAAIPPSAALFRPVGVAILVFLIGFSTIIIGPVARFVNPELFQHLAHQLVDQPALGLAVELGHQGLHQFALVLGRGRVDAQNAQ